MKALICPFIGIFLGFIVLNNINLYKLSGLPRITSGVYAEEVRVSTVNPTPFDKFDNQILSGEASYYSRIGCIGCSTNLRMANSEPLDDQRNTIALSPSVISEYDLMNKMVVVENLDNGQKTYARVTDSGGFAKYNRVADLTIQTRDSRGCKNICQVSIKIK